METTIVLAPPFNTLEQTMARHSLIVVTSTSTKTSGRVRERTDRKVTSKGAYWQLLGKGTTLSTCRALDLMGAMATFRGWLDEQERGEAGIQLDDTLTVGQVFDQYREHRMDAPSDKTGREVADSTKRIINTQLGKAQEALFKYSGAAYCFGDVRAASVTQAMLASLIDQMQGAVNTRTTTLIYVLAALRYGGETMGWYTNPKLRRFKVKPHAGQGTKVNCDYIPTREDIGKVLPHLTKGWQVTALKLYAIYGMRVSELANLEWARVDLDGGTIDLTESKTGARTLDIPPPVHALLTELKAHQEAHPMTYTKRMYVLGMRPSTVQKFSASKMEHTGLARACRLAAVPRFTVKGLRKYAIYRLLETNNAVHVANIMGNSVKVIQESYVDKAASMKAVTGEW